MNQTGPEPPHRQWTTPELVDLCLAGDRLAFRRLVEQYQGYAYGLAFRILGEREDARDATQETFVRVWVHLKAYDPRGKFTTWLYRIVVNIAIDRLRSRKRRLQTMDVVPEELEQRDDPAGQPGEIAATRDLVSHVRSLASGLPPKQHMVFVLRDLEDRTVEEVGAILGMSLSSVKTNLCYARRWIRTRMEDLEKGGGAR